MPHRFIPTIVIRGEYAKAGYLTGCFQPLITIPIRDNVRVTQPEMGNVRVQPHSLSDPHIPPFGKAVIVAQSDYVILDVQIRVITIDDYNSLRQFPAQVLGMLFSVKVQ